MPKFLLLNRGIAALVVMFTLTLQLSAQSIYPSQDGDRTRCNVQIDFKKAYISGICMMLNESQTVRASVMNEFGVSALSFTYDENKGKVKIQYVIKQLNKWYIKRVLKRDLREVMTMLKDESGNTYKNERFNIKYTFTPMQDETKE